MSLWAVGRSASVCVRKLSTKATVCMKAKGCTDSRKQLPVSLLDFRRFVRGTAAEALVTGNRHYTKQSCFMKGENEVWLSSRPTLACISEVYLHGFFQDLEKYLQVAGDEAVQV